MTADRLHGAINESGSHYWCHGCQEWIPVTEWESHKAALLKVVESSEATP